GAAWQGHRALSEHKALSVSWSHYPVRVKNMLKHGIVILQSRTIGNTDRYHILSPSPKNAHMSIEQYSYEQL
ncbi:hypothetical protein RQK77_26340, partial [Escherichia coli]